MLVFKALGFAENASAVSKNQNSKESAPFELLLGPEKPFWKSQKAQKRLKKRDILVSVTSDEITKKAKGKDEVTLKKLSLKGVGQVKGDFEATQKRILQFESLRKISPENFKEIKYDSKKKQLFIHGVAMWWEAKMLFQLFEQKVSQKSFRLHWRCIQGVFYGMTGFIEIEDLGVDKERRSLELSMIGSYQAEKLPLPSLLLNFGLETVLKTVAQKMRSFLEESSVDSTQKKIK